LETLGPSIVGSSNEGSCLRHAVDSQNDGRRFRIAPVSEVTQILAAVGDGDAIAASRLLSLVYDELRTLASTKLAYEKPGQTLQATALVHEAYLRLVGGEQSQRWDSRGHFFAAAAEAMRRILIDRARRKKAVKHGGQLKRVDLNDEPPISMPCDSFEELLALDEALDRLAAADAGKATLVKLLYYAGLNLDDAAAAQGISRTTAHRHWMFARAWLKDAIDGQASEK
jgi:RNA polymerase sigma factor (TIGR02999 family)